MKFQFVKIEKEIELISNRKIDSPFVSNLVKLEKHKRDLLQSKNLERIQSAFLNSPIYNADFYAGKILTKSTNYKKINRKKPITPMLIVAGVFGAIFGFFYVLIASSIKQRYKS